MTAGGEGLPIYPPPYPAVVESTEEFHFVERLVPPACVPPPPQHPSYPTPSGWTPPQVPPPSLPYHVGRSRMHNLPLYRRVTKGSRRITELRHIRGDIWALEKELREFVGQRVGKEPLTQVNEVTGTLRLKGHVDSEVRAWLLLKGF
ncbi:39S ribosomal protein L49, mitochondrial [Phasianus colchicus]|uniref:39S ribosomal protein L49, mitochondrial n=1 Tax=Phasianus colchicus TaxID=9054 RepID=UPI00129DC229|nr:39S ribosomal protein L49, mitochondrial [Phasianus colchicus]